MKKKTKLIVFLFIVLLLPLLGSCTYINSLMEIAEGATANKAIPNKELNVNYYVDDELYKTEKTTNRRNFSFPDDPKKEGLNFGGWTYKDTYQTLKTTDVIYTDKDSIDLYAYFSKGTHFIDNLKYNGPYLSLNAMPSLGDVNVLVVPVDLGGYTTSDMITSINEAFNGTSESTGFESVSSYYKKSSNGRLNLTFDVDTTWFKPSKEASYYSSYDATKDRYYDTGSGLILNEYLQARDKDIDFSKYDSDKDGYIDAIWMIYNVEPSYTDTSFYWAYVTFSQNKSKKYDDIYPRYYGFASYYFIYERELQKKYNRELELYDMSDIIYDAHTYIHETGHLMGLDDYYDNDTSKGGTGGLYTAGMMDANQGDLNTIDKLLLGWIDPYVIYNNSDIKTYDISSFADTNEVILVSKYKPGSIYSEYYLIEFYSNTGLNAHDKPIDYPSNALIRMHRLTNLKDYGIRVLHINASLTNEYNGKTYDQPMDFTYNNSTTRNLFVDTIVSSTYAYETSLTGKRQIINSLALFNEVGIEFNLKESVYKTTNGSSVYFNFKIDELATTGAKVSIIF